MYFKYQNGSTLLYYITELLLQHFTVVVNRGEANLTCRLYIIIAVAKIGFDRKLYLTSTISNIITNYSLIQKLIQLSLKINKKQIIYQYNKGSLHIMNDKKQQQKKAIKI